MRIRPELAIAAALTLSQTVNASLGDRQPDFKQCVKDCVKANCGPDGASIREYFTTDSTKPYYNLAALQHRILLWDCPSECDYTCQHVITNQRIARDPPYREPILQFHGKWPFYRFMGMQEPFSVVFSLMNFLAHDHGMSKLREYIPASYPLRKYYLLFGYFGLASWMFSMIFHTRDFSITEKLDYFGAGASVMYGLFYTPIRIFRLDENTPVKSSIVRAWTLVCVTLYVAHISYLTFWSFDYTYNMAANVVVGIVQNLLWSWFSVTKYQKTKRVWTAWPGLIVAWIILAMSLELFDFPPWHGMVDAHSLWHLGTVIPTIWWYNFLIKDAQEDMQGTRLKA